MATKKSKSFGTMISEFFGGKAKHTKSTAASKKAAPKRKAASKSSKSKAKKS